jgi:hypothetical protein
MLAKAHKSLANITPKFWQFSTGKNIGFKVFPEIKIVFQKNLTKLDDLTVINYIS